MVSKCASSIREPSEHGNVPATGHAADETRWHNGDGKVLGLASLIG
jgi:hypothetical protein